MESQLNLERVENIEVDGGNTGQFTIVGKAGERVIVKLPFEKIATLVAQLLGLSNAMRMNGKSADVPNHMRRADDVILVRSLEVFELLGNPEDKGLIFVIDTLDGRRCQIALSHSLGKRLRETLSR